MSRIKIFTLIGMVASVFSIVIGAVLVSGTASAAAGGNGGGNRGGKSSSFSLAMVVDANGNGAPNWGDRVTFDVSTTATTQPHVSLTCWQNGVVVYGAVTGYYDGYPWPWTQEMTLSSILWSGGVAECTAGLYYYKGSRKINLASLSFTAGA